MSFVKTVLGPPSYEDETRASSAKEFADETSILPDTPCTLPPSFFCCWAALPALSRASQHPVGIPEFPPSSTYTPGLPFQADSEVWCLGAYERVLFYYAYLIDLEKSGSTFARHIASGCEPVPCDANRFVKFISRYPVTDSIQIDNMKWLAVPDMEKMAKDLFDKKMTGEIVFDSLVKGKHRGYDDVLQSVSDWLKNKAVLSNNEALKQGVRSAMRAVVVARQDATTSSFFEKNKAKYPNRHVYPVPLYEGTKEGDTAKIINHRETGVFNGVTLRDVQDDFADFADKGHKSNIKVLTNALREFTELCLSP